MSSVKVMDSDILQMQNYSQKSTIRVTTLIAYQNEIQMLGPSRSRRLNKLMLYYKKKSIIIKCINDNNNNMKLVYKL